MSVAGGWFFLMACEMFVLGSRDFRLPGIGSYLQTAASAGDIRAIVWGLVAMILIIAAIDSIVWKPLMAWADKFKFEDVAGVARRPPYALRLLRRSRIAATTEQTIMAPVMERVTRFFAAREPVGTSRGVRYSPAIIVAIAGGPVLVLAFIRIGVLFSTLTAAEIRELESG
jgi:NitT/TauT family transport system permease protein